MFGDLFCVFSWLVGLVLVCLLWVDLLVRGLLCSFWFVVAVFIVLLVVYCFGFVAFVSGLLVLI